MARQITHLPYEVNMAKAKSMAPGGGGRFEKMKKKVGSSALAAYIGRKKYGKAKFQKMASEGKKKAPNKKAKK